MPVCVKSYGLSNVDHFQKWKISLEKIKAKLVKKTFIAMATNQETPISGRRKIQ